MEPSSFAPGSPCNSSTSFPKTIFQQISSHRLRNCGWSTFQLIENLNDQKDDLHNLPEQTRKVRPGRRSWCAPSDSPAGLTTKKSGRFWTKNEGINRCVACTGSKEAKKTVENIVENSPDSSHALAPCGPSTLTNNLCKRNQRLCPIPTLHRGSFGNGKHRATRSKFVMLASNSQKHENSSKETNHQIHQKAEHVRIHRHFMRIQGSPTSAATVTVVPKLWQKDLADLLVGLKCHCGRLACARHSDVVSDGTGSFDSLSMDYHLVI